MKKYLIILSSILLFPTIVLGSFNDVPSSNQFYNAINYVQTQGIVQGYPDGSFKPFNKINRAEFTKILMLSLYPSNTFVNYPSSKNFPDVLASDWFAPYVWFAVDFGIIKGYPDGSFKASNNINFAEASKMLIEAYGIGHFATSGPWYEQYINAIVSFNAKPSTITQFDQQITRGEMAEMIYKLKSSITTTNKTTQQSQESSLTVQGTYYTRVTGGSAIFFRPTDNTILENPADTLWLHDANNFNGPDFYSTFNLSALYDKFETCSLFYGTATIVITPPKKYDTGKEDSTLISVKERSEPTCNQYQE